jgi:hypothetical protein
MNSKFYLRSVAEKETKTQPSLIKYVQAHKKNINTI